MKSVNLGFLFLVFFICTILSLAESRKGKNVGGRNNIPVYPDGQMPLIQKIKVEERQRFRSVEDQVERGTIFKDFLFTVEGIEQFLINLPITQQVVLNMFAYVMYDGAYLTPTNIDSQPPIKVFIYENNNRLVHQSDFYFQNYILFEGQQLSTYTIRFINSGSQKLITMNLKKLTQTNHVEHLADKNAAQSHAVQAEKILQQLRFLSNAFERYTMINFQAVKTLLKKISLYYYWHLFQTFVAVFVCILQVISIGKICQTQPIV